MSTDIISVALYCKQRNGGVERETGMERGRKEEDGVRRECGGKMTTKGGKGLRE